MIQRAGNHAFGRFIYRSQGKCPDKDCDPESDDTVSVVI